MSKCKSYMYARSSLRLRWMDPDICEGAEVGLDYDEENTEAEADYHQGEEISTLPHGN